MVTFHQRHLNAPAFLLKKVEHSGFHKIVVATLIVYFLPCVVCAAVGADSGSVSSEVAAFILNGNKPWQVLTISDLDTVVLPSGQRLMPLLRLLKALEIAVESRNEEISFTGPNGSKLLIDTTKKEMEINGGKKPVELFIGVSDITSEREIYLPPSVIADMLAMKVEWDERYYQFAAKTDQKLSIWKRTPGMSLASIKTTEVKSYLPELFGPGRPSKFSLDFMEFQFNPFFNWSKLGSYFSQMIVVNSPKESFWGSAFGGRYRLQFTQANLSWSTASGFQKPTSSRFMLNSASWTHPLPGAEIAVGDFAFGLSDLVFPVLQMTGLRFSGLRGMPTKEDQWSLSPGMTNSFLIPEVFQGSAPAGSEVELVVNGRSMEKLAVSVGTYKFEEVNLVPGILNIVRIIITEPGGFQRVTERCILGKSINLRKGGLVYLGGIGTDRQNNNWTLHGYIAGGRALYGLTNSLTVGTTWAKEQSFYLPVQALSLASGGRSYPESSSHWGWQAVWVPMQHLVLQGDASISRGNGGNQGEYNGSAYKIQETIYPSSNTQIITQYFHYSPGFFNGQNTQMNNREGYTANGIWNINRRWSVTSTYLSARNLVPEVEDPSLCPYTHAEGCSLYVDFKSLQIAAKAILRSTITLGVDRITANWEGTDAKMLYTLNIQASPSPDVFFQGSFSKGEYLDPSRHPEFFGGIRVPGFTTYSPPKVDATLRVAVMPSTRIGASFFEDPQRKRITLSYSFSPQGNKVQLSTETGYDLNYRKPVVIGRADLALNKAKNKHVILDARYEQGMMSAFLTFNLKDLFSLNRGETTHINDFSTSPDRAGVQGRVFIDANANGRMDPGEPGLAGVVVVMDDTFKVTTDKRGYFLIQAIGKNKQSRISIDMKTVPAIYSPTHATQTALLGPVGLTEINLAVTPFHSISGIVQISTPDKGTQPVKGILVRLVNMNDGKKITDSITAHDGSYWLGDVRPGKYYLEMDTKTLPPKCTFAVLKQPIEVPPKIEPQELKIAPFEGVVLNKELIDGQPQLPVARSEESKPVLIQQQPALF